MTLRAGICLLIATTAPAFGQFTQVSTPTASYTSSTTLISLSGSDFSDLSSVTSGSQTVTFSNPLELRTVTGSWSTWGGTPNTEGPTPRVLFSQGLTNITLTLSTPASAFGFEIEPASFGVHTVTATFKNGAATLGTVTLSVDGSAGALLAAATSSPSITSVVIDGPTSDGFAIGRLRYAIPTVTSVPALTPAGIGGLGVLLAAAGALLARKHQLAA